MANIFFAKNYVKIAPDTYWNQGRVLPGFRFGGINLAMPNQHGELEPSGGIPGGALRILAGSDPLGRKFGSKYDGFGEMTKDEIEEQRLRSLYGDDMISNNVNEIITTFGQSIESLGISQEEWNFLSTAEQDKIKKCN